MTVVHANVMVSALGSGDTFQKIRRAWLERQIDEPRTHMRALLTTRYATDEALLRRLIITHISPPSRQGVTDATDARRARIVSACAWAKYILV